MEKIVGPDPKMRTIHAASFSCGCYSVSVLYVGSRYGSYFGRSEHGLDDNQT
jgi:hypothetical protein